MADCAFRRAFDSLERGRDLIILFMIDLKCCLENTAFSLHFRITFLFGFHLNMDKQYSVSFVFAIEITLGDSKKSQYEKALNIQ